MMQDRDLSQGLLAWISFTKLPIYSYICFYFDTENYIPIILVIIGAVVVVIFVIFFIYIYLTYYKKNKMGHYDVKKPNARKELLVQPEESPWRNSFGVFP